MYGQVVDHKFSKADGVSGLLPVRYRNLTVLDKYMVLGLLPEHLLQELDLVFVRRRGLQSAAILILLRHERASIVQTIDQLLQQSGGQLRMQLLIRLSRQLQVLRVR